MKEKLLQLLAEICDDEVVLEETDVDLFESGLLDSIDYLNLLVEVESRFNISIAPSEVSKEEINTPEKFAEYVISRA
ncbi:MAG: D-alanine--poly(phosphoribitol) ligase subunit DltC [Lachnospiraceae bacterium]|nr:D-alanine--poly(phosphoribitol) ligase subunit DltC [Lachnospiraceae bacterium]MBO7361807.1 D-alanine--poly(phosphoribitol) ligase subunit DltC [Lachnospiraceae bacterium]MBP5252903.1 D-alanine--poly(phosphoribitol) ligase subunit DltC [Lachnospiraceae bacterium]MBP5702915.1 D-alanine--poly(phosphoribitol) ligase subunit DltC [Lachnospiraceae bacterium]MBP5762529.1 D-alanine--poly(phosphoribitol) ligase subunit DltC [Lachnospiraceae bacterium]